MVAYRGMKRATLAEKLWMSLVKGTACCACTEGMQQTPTEVHHIVRANKRLGHFYVLPLCQFHHHNVASLRNLEQTYWEMLNEKYRISDRSWPESKIIARRA
jgi:hypothetical protein